VSSSAGLSADQQGADEAFASWLSAADGSPFLLSGHAGTGKTFLSMRFLAQAEAAGLCWTVVAPTHKAVSVLRANLAASQLTPTWFPSTIHRLLRLNLKRRGDRELCEASEQTAGALEHLDLVLIDEASMLDSTVLELLLRCAHGFRTRLVFVGDPAQLPPVGESASPVFQLARVRGRWNAARAVDVLVREGDAVQRAAQGAAHLPRFGGASVIERCFGRDPDEGVDLRVQGFSADQCGLRQFDGRDALRGDRGGGFGDGQHQRRSARMVKAGSAASGIAGSRSEASMGASIV
jgi:hypothetical protein